MDDSYIGMADGMSARAKTGLCIDIDKGMEHAECGQFYF
jgi:hypothetical protein